MRGAHRGCPARRRTVTRRSGGVLRAPMRVGDGVRGMRGRVGVPGRQVSAARVLLRFRGLGGSRLSLERRPGAGATDPVRGGGTAATGGVRLRRTGGLARGRCPGVMVLRVAVVCRVTGLTRGRCPGVTVPMVVVCCRVTGPMREWCPGVTVPTVAVCCRVAGPTREGCLRGAVLMGARCLRVVASRVALCPPTAVPGTGVRLRATVLMFAMGSAPMLAVVRVPRRVPPTNGRAFPASGPSHPWPWIRRARPRLRPRHASRTPRPHPSVPRAARTPAEPHRGPSRPDRNTAR